MVESVEVETGLRDKDFVAVSGPVLAGEEIVSKAGTFVADGDRVTAVRDDQTGAVRP